jgi:hypothetical protein
MTPSAQNAPTPKSPGTASNPASTKQPASSNAAKKKSSSPTKKVKQAAASTQPKTPPKSSKKESTEAHEESAPPAAEPKKAKGEGPIKKMLRRVVEEIHDNSYDAVIAALKDKTLMKDLHKARHDPIPVKIVEVDTSERIVYIKNKLGPKEPVTFRLIRRLLSDIRESA